VVNEGESRSLFVSATDPEGDPITLSASQLPPFATFLDNGSGHGTLTLTPDFDEAGVYPGVTIQASDGLLSSTQEFTITVNEAAPEPRPASHLPGRTPPNGKTAPHYRFSSVQNTFTSVRPENAIDNSASSGWVTADGQITNQWIKVNLTGNGLHVVDRVMLKGAATNNGLRDFEIRVSTTGSADADFTTIFTGTVPQDSNVHEFTFAPAQAAYVQLFVRNNWGYATNMLSVTSRSGRATAKAASSPCRKARRPVLLPSPASSAPVSRQKTRSMRARARPGYLPVAKPPINGSRSSWEAG
jgi:hypothetical protein